MSTIPSRLEMLKKFVAARPGDPFPRYGLAQEHKNAGRLEDAREEFAILLRDHPDYTAGYLHAGNVLVALGQRAEARSLYQLGIEACQRKGDGHARGELEGALEALQAPNDDG